MMLQKNLVLKDDADLQYAIHFQSKVAVLQNGEIIDTGIIESYSKDAVKLNNGYILRKLCELRVL